VLAALAGLVILGQHLVTHEWAGIIIVVAANMITTLQQSRGQVDVSEDSSSVEAGQGGPHTDG
jgi:threonine/homoserine efflux transporter RhtA